MTNKKKRILHSPEFKAEALKLAEKVGVAAAARQLSLHESRSTVGVRQPRKTPAPVSGKKI